MIDYPSYDPDPDLYYEEAPPEDDYLDADPGWPYDWAMVAEDEHLDDTLDADGLFEYEWMEM
jgi:hypothetical protein